MKDLEIKEGEDLQMFVPVLETEDSDMKRKEGACPCGPDIYLPKEKYYRLTKDAAFLWILAEIRPV